MIGNVTNLLLAQMLLSSRQPNSEGGQQTRQDDPGPAESENVWMPRETPLGFERSWPDADSWRPQQRWSEEHRWPAADEFLPLPLREQRRKLEEQQRRRLYYEGLDRLRKLMEENLRLGPEQREREREERLRRGDSMIG